jgi:tellurite resistance protein
MKKLIPASFFGMILGLAGLGNVWRVGAKMWGLPHIVGEVIMAVAVIVWILLIVSFVSKWIRNPNEARAELAHPVLCCFIGLAPVSTALVGLAVAPYNAAIALALFWIGSLGQMAFGLFRTGQLWKGGRDPNATTPVLYLPSVAGSFVSSIAATAFGYPELAQLFFGAGLFSWLALESIVLHRLYIQESLPKALRPTLGIQLAPSVVGCAAYLGLTTGRPDLFAHLLLGYGLLQALMLIRLQGWLREQPFSAAYWAFTFGATALAFSCMKFVDRGMTGPYVPLAEGAFVAANLLVGWIFIRSVVLLLKGGLIPPTLLAPEPATP